MAFPGLLTTSSLVGNYVHTIKYRGVPPKTSCLLYELVTDTRGVRWSKFAGMGKEKNAFPLKKDLSLPIFFFFLFLGMGLFLFLIFLGISHPVFHHSFPVFSSFHLSKTVLGFWMGLNLAILERVLNRNLSKPILRYSMNRSSPFLKSFLIFFQPVFLSNKEKREPRRASLLKGFILASV